MLLAVMAAVFAVWMAGLVVMYLKTVYPAHHAPGERANQSATNPVAQSQSSS